MKPDIRLVDKKSAPQTLVEFMRDQRRKDCVVCQLPAAVQEQLQEARRLKILINDQVAWLTSINHTVSAKQLLAHRSARHDDGS